MGKYATHVYTDPAQIATLERWVRELEDEARVQLTLADGTRLLGTVAVRPTVQTFRDADENEGLNGLLRLDDLDNPVQQHRVWLDTIREVRPLPPGEG